MTTLYHYIHCPFCLRVRMLLGYLDIPYNSKVLAYNDEKTPIDLTGQKMLPIVKFDDGEVSNESLQIMLKLDKEKRLNIEKLLNSEEFRKINSYLDKFGNSIHKVAMPYFIYTPEFDEKSREYFQKKKEKYKGPFKELYRKRNEYFEQLNTDLVAFEHELKNFYKSDEISLFDILLASHLWAMYIVPEYQFPEKIHQYLQRVGRTCNFEYHKDSWL